MKVWAAVYATDPQAGYIVFGVYTSKTAAEAAIQWREECDVQSEDLWVEQFTLDQLCTEHYKWVS